MGHIDKSLLEKPRNTQGEDEDLHASASIHVYIDEDALDESK